MGCQGKACSLLKKNMAGSLRLAKLHMNNVLWTDETRVEIVCHKTQHICKQNT